MHQLRFLLQTDHPFRLLSSEIPWRIQGQHLRLAVADEPLVVPGPDHCSVSIDGRPDFESFCGHLDSVYWVT